MSICGALCTFLKLKKTKVNEDSAPPESHSASSCQVRILDIERAEHAKWATQIQHTERLCATQKAQTNTVLKRLGFNVPDDTGPSPQHQAFPKKSPRPSLRGSRIRPISEDDKGDCKSRTNQTLQEEDPFFEKKLHLGSQMAIITCKLAKFTEASRNSSPDSLLSSVDMQTPRELRAIGQFLPSTPPTAATRRPTHLPVLAVKYGQAEKYVADGCKLQTAQSKVDNFVKRLDKFHLLNHPPPLAATRRAKVQAPPSYIGQRHRWRTVIKSEVRAPPSSPYIGQRCRGFLEVKHKVPAPLVPPNKRQPFCGSLEVKPKVPAPPSPPYIGQRHRWTTVVKPEVPAPPSSPYIGQRYRGFLEVKPKVPAPLVPPNKRALHIGPKLCTAKAGQEDLQALVNPAESLSLSFKQLISDEWEKNLDGLKCVHALARHHPALLQTKLHEVCLLLIKGVNNLRSAVACSALDCIRELYVHLGRAMDTKAEWMGQALLQKLAKTTNVFIHQRANLALDALVERCCPGRVMSVLFNTGLRHACVAVRESTARHLHKLADIVGEDHILKSGKIFTERFLTAVSRMAVDATPEVRHYGRVMIQGLAQQRALIPAKYLPPLEKILRKMRQ